jgi:hypothetical protein
MLGKYFREVFGKQRTKFIMAHNLNFLGIHRDKRIEKLLAKPENVTVTSRGIWTEICVNDAIDSVCDAYGIPRDNCSIDFNESVLAETRLSTTTLEELGLVQEEIHNYPHAQYNRSRPRCMQFKHLSTALHDPGSL